MNSARPQIMNKILKHRHDESKNTHWQLTVIAEVES